MANLNLNGNVSKNEETLQLAHSNLITFGKLFSPQDFLASATPDFHIDVGKMLIDRSKQQLALVLPRDHAKSTLAACAVLHRFLFATKDRPEFIAWIGEAQDQARDNLNWIANHIYSNPAIHYYFGDLQGDKWTKDEITLSNDNRWSGVDVGLSDNNHAPTKNTDKRSVETVLERMLNEGRWSDVPKNNLKDTLKEYLAFHCSSLHGNSRNASIEKVLNKVHPELRDTIEYSPEEAVSKLSTQKVVVNNKEFNSKAEAARYYGKVPENVQSLVRKGATLEQALGLEPIKQYKYEWNKEQFTSKRELADYVSKNTGISSKLIKSRLNKGMSIDEVISLGNKKITNPGRYNLTILERDVEESNKNALIYFVEINLDSQKFYKVGITTQDVEKRLVNYDHNIISTREGKLIDMYKLEQHILHQYENKKIYDKFDKYTDGITEFLDLNINDVEKINSLINTS